MGESVVLEEEAAKKFLTPAIAPVLGKLLARFEAFPTFSKQVWEEAFKKFVEEEGMKMGQLAQPVRVALTGRTASPGLFEVMEVLGRDRTLLRLRQGIERAIALHKPNSVNKFASILTKSRAVYYCVRRLGDRLAVGRQSLDLTT